MQREMERLARLGGGRDSGAISGTPPERKSPFQDSMIGEIKRRVLRDSRFDKPPFYSNLPSVNPGSSDRGHHQPTPQTRLYLIGMPALTIRLARKQL